MPRSVSLVTLLSASSMLLGAACSGREAPPAREQPALHTMEPAARAAAVTDPAQAELSDAGATAAPAATVATVATVAPEPKRTEPAPPSACPPDMQLVDGEYCSEVQQTCEQSWFDKANQKLICERFSEPSTCVGSRAHERYCIDRYEWPNREGERPEVMNNFYQAMVKCAALGKRMCTESEWTLACEGPKLLPYPYGYVRDSNKCNGDRPWDSPDMQKVARRDPAELARLWQGKRSGSQPECVSDYGVHDLPGNADEVVASENFGSSWRGKYESVTTGGPWYRGVRNQCRPKIYTHDEGFYYYYLSFRCCAEPDGASSDPRTPKQIKAGTAFGSVERLARFSASAMREKLRLRAEGKCTCADQDTLCKTMCGTLLGASAVDAR